MARSWDERLRIGDVRMGVPSSDSRGNTGKDLEEGPELFLVRNTQFSRARQWGRRRKDGMLGVARE